MKMMSDLLIERAHGLAAELRQRAREIDGGSKLPDDIVRKFIDLDLVSVLTPRRFGGGELGLPLACDIIRIVAAADQAAAWVLAFYIGHNFIHCQFPEEGQREIYAAGPSPCSAGVLAPTLKLRPAPGGYRVSGRNGWNSGSPHAQWIMGSGFVEGEAARGPVVFIVPAREVELVDTWDVQGMRATGSWDAVFDDVFVPEHRTLAGAELMGGRTPGSALHENAFYARPLVLVTFAYCLAPFVGALRGAADEFIRCTKTRMTTNDGRPVVAKPTAHMRAGHGEVNARIAEMRLAEMVRAAAGPEGASMDVAERLAFKALSADLTDFCKDAVNELVLGSGASAFRSDSLFQAVFRNLNMISVHAFFDNDASMEGYGRVLLGLECNTPI